jgi:hypothetical protein
MSKVKMFAVTLIAAVALLGAGAAAYGSVIVGDDRPCPGDCGGPGDSGGLDPGDWNPPVYAEWVQDFLSWWNHGRIFGFRDRSDDISGEDNDRDGDDQPSGQVIDQEFLDRLMRDLTGNVASEEKNMWVSELGRTLSDGGHGLEPIWNPGEGSYSDVSTLRRQAERAVSDAAGHEGEGGLIDANAGAVATQIREAIRQGGGGSSSGNDDEGTMLPKIGIDTEELPGPAEIVNPVLRGPR